MAGPVHAIAFNGTTYVRVSLSGLIQTSTDGLNWTNRTSGVSVDLWGAAWGAGYFVVCGVSGTILRSADGTTWTDQTASSDTSENLYSVMYSDMFMCCGANGTIVSSPFGDVWGAITSGTSEDLWDITGAEGVYIAVGDEDVVVTGAIITTQLDVTLSEDIDATQGETIVGTFNHTISEDINHIDDPYHDLERLTYYRVLSENMLISMGGSSENLDTNVTVPETINITERPFINNESIVDAVTIAQVLTGAYGFTISEAIDVADSTAYIYTAGASITEDIDFDDIMSPSVIVPITITDGVEVDEAIGSIQTFTALINEAITVSTVIAVDGEVYTAWVINTRNKAITEYSHYSFHSFAKHKGKYYAAGPTGILHLEGETDDGWLIKSVLRSGILDFGNEFQKRMPRMYLGLRNNGTIVLKTVTNENIVRWYQLRENQSGIGQGRVKGTKGVKSAYWQFELANVTGEDFELDSVKLMPVVLTRRIK